MTMKELYGPDAVAEVVSLKKRGIFSINISPFDGKKCGIWIAFPDGGRGMSVDLDRMGDVFEAEGIPEGKIGFGMMDVSMEIDPSLPPLAISAEVTTIDGAVGKSSGGAPINGAERGCDFLFEIYQDLSIEKLMTIRRRLGDCIEEIEP